MVFRASQANLSVVVRTTPPFCLVYLSDSIFTKISRFSKLIVSVETGKGDGFPRSVFTISSYVRLDFFNAGFQKRLFHLQITSFFATRLLNGTSSPPSTDSESNFVTHTTVSIDLVVEIKLLTLLQFFYVPLLLKHNFQNFIQLSFTHIRSKNHLLAHHFAIVIDIIQQCKNCLRR